MRQALDNRALKIPALLAGLLLPLCLQAETQTTTKDWMKIDTAPRQEASGVSYESKADYSYVGGASFAQGKREIGTVDEQTSSFNFVASIPATKNLRWRLGIDWERFSFGTPGNSHLPNTLQSLAFVVGADVSLSDKWIMRMELQPGLYSDFEDISAEDFSAQAVIGASYLVNSKLQWVFGVGLGFYQEIPAFPAVGVRWQFADDWTLNAILPKPRLEYKIMNGLNAYAGAELKGGGYRVSKDFGSANGDGRFNSAVVEYMELRTGVGISYQILPALTAELEGGYVPYRREDFYRLHTHEIGQPAPYVQAGLKASF